MTGSWDPTYPVSGGNGGVPIDWDEIHTTLPNGDTYSEVILIRPATGTHLVIPTDVKMRLAMLESTVEWHRKIGYNRQKHVDKRLGLLTAAVVVQFLLIVLMLAMWPL